MTNKKIWLGMLALALIFGMTVVGCGGDDDDNKPQVSIGDWYTWGSGITASAGADGVITLNINEITEMDDCGLGFACSGQKGKTYKYTFQAWTKSDTREMRFVFGRETAEWGGLWYPNRVITINSTKQTYELEYDISDAWDDFNISFNCGGAIGELYIKLISIGPVDVNSGNPNGGGGGTLTVTGIPAGYNGKYAFFDGDNDRVYLVGCQQPNLSTQTFAGVQILNGKVDLPVWSITGRVDSVTDNFIVTSAPRYSGNATFSDENTPSTFAEMYFGIYSSPTGYSDELFIGSPSLINFSNGSATITWSSINQFN
jgi:hypothetical protein